MRGIISFIRVDNFVVDSIHYIGTGTFQFFFQMCDVNNGVINHLNIKSNKDGLDILGPADNIAVTKSIFTTADDGIYVGSFGYPTVTPLVGNISNITITDCIDEYVADGGGSLLRMQCSAWKNWHTGYSYQIGDAVTNAGYVYRKMDNDTKISTVAPTFTIFDTLTLADNIQWRCLQADTITGIKISNIIVKNITMNSARRLYTCDADSSPDYTHTIYQGSFGRNIVTNITFDNVIWTQSHLWSEQVLLVMPSQNMGTVTLKNSTIIQHGLGGIVYFGTSGNVQEAALDSLIFDNCTIDLSSATDYSYGICLAYGGSYQANLNVLKLKNCYITGKQAEPGTYIIKGNLASMYNHVIIQNTTLNNLERFAYHYANSHMAIIMLNSIWTNSEYFIAVTTNNGVISLNTTNCIFNQPTQYMLFNNSDNSTLTVNTAGSSGTLLHSNVSAGGGIINITGDLP